MSRNGSGTYSLPAGNPVVTGTVLSSTVQNNTLSDIATALTQSIASDGQTTPSANLPMGGFKLTGLGAGTAAGNSVRYEQLTGAAQNAGMTILSSVTGTSTVAGVLTPSLAAYATGQKFAFVPAGTNTGATTLNVDSLGAKNVFWNGAACVGGEIRASVPVEVMYDGTQFHLVSNGFAAPFLDTYPLVEGSADSTKKVRLEVDGISATTTRVVTVPDRDLTIGPVLAAEQASTSGTSIDFTGIPAGTKRITVMFKGVSTNGSSAVIVQIGDAGGIEASGYVGTASKITGATTATSAFTTGFPLVQGIGATSVLNGSIVLNLENSAAFSWIATGGITDSDTTSNNVSAGAKSTSAELDRVRITTVNGTDAFDAGAISISYE